MRRFGSRMGLALATLLMGVGAGLATPAQAALNPYVTINGSCNVTVSVGERICIQYGLRPVPAQATGARGLLTVQKGSGPEQQLFNGEVFGESGNELCDVVGPGPETRIIRFRVRNPNSNVVELATCSYTVRTTSQSLPVISSRLLVNNQYRNCGASVAAGSLVYLVFSSSQSGTAEIYVKKDGATSATLLARGSVTAGRSYAVGVRAGTADGAARTFTVRVTNSAGTGEGTCAYIVSP